MTARATGIPVEAFEFYERLAANNSRTWWQEHKGDYERFVREPLTALVEELADEFGRAHLFRPYRDTRFAKDKTPLKDHQGAFVGIEDAVGYYVQISAAGLMVAGGWYAPEGQQVARFRAAVEEGAAAHVRRLVADVEKRGFEVDSRPLKTRPRGVDPEHPDLDVLRFRALVASRSYAVAPWLATRRALTTVRTAWRALAPMTEWLGDHVGPGRDPADGLA